MHLLVTPALAQQSPSCQILRSRPKQKMEKLLNHKRLLQKGNGYSFFIDNEPYTKTPVPSLTCRPQSERRYRKTKRRMNSLGRITCQWNLEEFYKVLRKRSSRRVSTVIDSIYSEVLPYLSPLPAFLSSLLKDIKAERPKITEKDNLRLLYLTKWFLEFFQLLHNQDKEQLWGYGLVGEVIERSWIAWVLKRIREAGEEKVQTNIPNVDSRLNLTALSIA